jgi:Replication protein
MNAINVLDALQGKHLKGIDRNIFGHATDEKPKVKLTWQQREELARKKSAEVAQRKADRAQAKIDNTPLTEEQRQMIWEHDHPGITAHEEEFRHSAWAPKRTRVKAALERAGTSQQVLFNFENCGADCTVYYHDVEQRYRLGAMYCKNRFCEPCMRAKQNTIAMNLRKKFDEHKPSTIRFFTFTLKKSDKPLKEQMDRLYDSFKQLRKLPVWKNTQKGGCMHFEVKWAKAKTAHIDAPEQWHPHLHCAVEGNYVDAQEIQHAWHQITGDSYVVDIRAIDKTKDAAWYIAKYVGKGVNDQVWQNDTAADEFVLAMKGRRTCATFGSWRGFKLLEKEPIDKAWRKVGTLNEIVQRFRQGEQWAIRLLDKLWNCDRYDPHRKRPKEKITTPPIGPPPQ